MMSEKLKESILMPLLKIIPFSLVRRIGSGKLIVLYFHAVNDENIPHICNLYRHKRTTEFEDDLEFLLTYYYPIGLQDVIYWIRGIKNLPPNCFLMTFDDGLRETFDVIAPILLNRGIPAVFFISSAFLDNRALCYQHKESLLVEKIRSGISQSIEKEIKNILRKISIPFSDVSDGILQVDYRRRNALEEMAEVLDVDFDEYLKIKRPYLTSIQIRRLIDQGFAIGAHSIDHPYYSSLKIEEQMEQTIVSVKEIRNKFILDYGAFAFPHNDAGVSKEFFNKLQESRLVDITFGTGGILEGGFANHKQRVSLENPLLPARDILKWHHARKVYKEFKWGKKTA
jgi:peptidoglycan/xylan/chitin deacetylase (PgdA/CDA1 family)